MSNNLQECICTKNCDCANPPPYEGAGGVWHISNECPEHNDNPELNPQCTAHQDKQVYHFELHPSTHTK